MTSWLIVALVFRIQRTYRDVLFGGDRITNDGLQISNKKVLRLKETCYDDVFLYRNVRCLEKKIIDALITDKARL